jgi:hypothetical protein
MIRPAAVQQYHGGAGAAGRRAQGVAVTPEIGEHVNLRILSSPIRRRDR